jgi:DNA (cytosine-5)-methyltransferase 1
MRVFSLFSGIGAFEKALENIGIDFELVGFSEIDKYAINSYCAIHNTSKDLNYGDITKIDINTLPKNIDLLVHGSPCTDYSLAGKNLGGDKDSGTRSSLMWYSVDIIRKRLPKIVVWENVPNVLSKRHIHNFEKYMEDLSELGYNHKYVVLNSKYFGVPQNRERLFCVSVLGKEIDFDFYRDYSNITFEDYVKVKDILECSDKIGNHLWMLRNVYQEREYNNKEIICVGQSSSKGSQAGKVYSIDGLFPTLCACTHGYALGYIEIGGKYRKLTPIETFRMMGFTEEDCKKCMELGTSETQLYKQAGNSIVVPVLEFIFRRIYKLG